MLPKPKYQQLSNHQLYIKAREGIIAGHLISRTESPTLDSIYDECCSRNRKIWEDAYSDAILTAITIEHNIECLNNRNFNDQMQVTRIERIDYMEPFELEMYLQPASAGFGSPAIDTVTKTQLLDFIGKYLKQSETYVCEVRGESMINANITNESKLIVNKTKNVKNGDIVIANLNGELLVKRYLRKKDKVILKSENAAYPDIEISGNDELTIWGKVELVIHRPG